MINATSGLDCIGFGSNFVNLDKSCADKDARAICEGLSIHERTYTYLVQFKLSLSMHVGTVKGCWTPSLSELPEGVTTDLPAGMHVLINGKMT